MPASHSVLLMLLGVLQAGELFFTDWTDLDIATRMQKWDRRFKVLTSYPQVKHKP